MRCGKLRFLSPIISPDLQRTRTCGIGPKPLVREPPFSGVEMESVYSFEKHAGKALRGVSQRSRPFSTSQLLTVGVK